MVEDRLNGLALMHIHQEIEPSIDEVINTFSLPVCGKCLIHPLFVLYLFCSTPATVVHIVNSQ